MQQSEEQFSELMAHFIVRTNKMLQSGQKIPPLGLLLHENGSVQVSLIVYDDIEQIPDLIQNMLESYSQKVLEQDIVASCIAIPNDVDQEVTVLLENFENYCIKYHIPIDILNQTLNMNEAVASDSDVYVFPILEG
ncbi:hypothetical protein NDN11_17555 [Acinetobacter sp. C26M]|uniref:hypothetical protein n=1 Tax=unclassified Acinetobacter TaxID=196816 RepID=UPI0020371E30|nr:MULTISPECIES: hypothetical protein [unclassified Acinetobacter]USA46461.1 hypothetical protein NDN11_17555 [Acinetobacter sp. C26M]USA49945.1 hypothetical protein NDN12_17470 [Acinetobacter sp. C26G]